MMNEQSAGASARLALTAFLLLTVATAGASCKRTSVENANATSANTVSEAETSATPPYPTKEPERYQATVVNTSGPISRETFVARDGEKRRMDFELLPGAKLTFIQLQDGRYLLYPAKKMYAEIGTTASNANGQGVPQDFSADKLINQARTGARYEKLGTEEVGGRTTTKYRVTTRGQTGEGKEVTTETFVWVDESLGMPVKSETTSTGGPASGSKIGMEIKDIKLEVDASLFALPKDYKKATREDIQREALSRLPGVLGADNEEKKENRNKR